MKKISFKKIKPYLLIPLYLLLLIVQVALLNFDSIKMEIENRKTRYYYVKPVDLHMKVEMLSDVHTKIYFSHDSIFGDNDYLEWGCTAFIPSPIFYLKGRDTILINNYPICAIQPKVSSDKFTLILNEENEYIGVEGNEKSDRSRYDYMIEFFGRMRGYNIIDTINNRFYCCTFRAGWDEKYDGPWSKEIMDSLNNAWY